MIGARFLFVVSLAAATVVGAVPARAAVTAANATASSDKPTALLVFPLIQVDATTGTDSLIQLTNVDAAEVGVRCIYQEPAGDPAFVSFDITLGANQPVAWYAGSGLSVVPGEGGAVPALGDGPYTGLLRCLAIDAAGLPSDRNVLVGGATLRRSGDTPAFDDAAQYNAIGFDAVTGAVNGDAQLTLGGPSAEYAACPESLSMQTLLDDAILDLGAGEGTQDQLSTTLALITCAQSAAGAGTVLNIAVVDELGFTLSTSISVQDQLVRQMSLLDTAAPERSIFNIGLRGTSGGNLRIRPTSTSGGVLGIAIQSHIDPNDVARVHSTAIRPQLSGQRTAADVVDLVIPTPPAVCVGDCDGSGGVQINELVTGVNIALGQTALSACEAFDRDDSGSVAISELVAAVNNALLGCR